MFPKNVLKNKPQGSIFRQFYKPDKPLKPKFIVPYLSIITISLRNTFTILLKNETLVSLLLQLSSHLFFFTPSKNNDAAERIIHNERWNEIKLAHLFVFHKFHVSVQ